MTVELVDLGEAAPINETIDQLIKLIALGQVAPKRLGPALERLGDLVYSPLAKYLTNVSHLIICPDGQLSRIPFEAVLHDNKYLVEQKTISYVSSGREVARVAQTKEKRRTSVPLVVGNPDFDLRLAAADNSTNKAATGSDSLIDAFELARIRGLSGAFHGTDFSPLPDSAEEARAVSEILGRNNRLLIGAEAREAELKSVDSPEVLHLATHGFFLPDQELKPRDTLRDRLFLETRMKGPKPDDWENPLVRCGLALAGANHALQMTDAVAEDGILTGLEAALLSLQGTELVILSACNTGAGDVKIGEGVMSLCRAFRIAGADAVLASHWRVSDKGHWAIDDRIHPALAGR